MGTLTLESEPVAVDVVFSADSFRVTIDDGRELSVPLAWFPRLLHGTPEQRDQWELIGRGEGLHWEALDEDISVAVLLAGRGDQNRTRPQTDQPSSGSGESCSPRPLLKVLVSTAGEALAECGS